MQRPRGGAFAASSGSFPHAIALPELAHTLEDYEVLLLRLAPSTFVGCPAFG